MLGLRHPIPVLRTIATRSCHPAEVEEGLLMQRAVFMADEEAVRPRFVVNVQPRALHVRRQIEDEYRVVALTRTQGLRERRATLLHRFVAMPGGVEGIDRTRIRRERTIAALRADGRLIKMRAERDHEEF